MEPTMMSGGNWGSGSKCGGRSIEVNLIDESHSIPIPLFEYEGEKLGICTSVGVSTYNGPRNFQKEITEFFENLEKEKREKVQKEIDKIRDTIRNSDIPSKITYRLSGMSLKDMNLKNPKFEGEYIGEAKIISENFTKEEWKKLEVLFTNEHTKRLGSVIIVNLLLENPWNKKRYVENEEKLVIELVEQRRKIPFLGWKIKPHLLVRIKK